MSAVGREGSQAGRLDPYIADGFEAAMKCYRMLRRDGIIDYTMSRSYRMVNALAVHFFETPWVDPQWIKTGSEKRMEEELALMRAPLDPQKASTRSIDILVTFVETIIPKLMHERYFKRWYLYPLKRSFFSKDNLLPFVNWEHFLLTQLTAKPYLKDIPLTRRQMGAALFKSLANFQRLHAASTGPIETLKRLAEKELLPTSLPKPVNLYSHNLEEELDNALYSFIEAKIEPLVDSYGPASLRDGIALGTVHKLFGKKLQAKVVTGIIIECVFRPLVDPYQLSLTLLSSLGRDTLPLDIWGFGPECTPHVLEIGQRMCKDLPDKYSPETLSHFTQSKLRASIGGQIEQEQRAKAKKLLIEALSELFSVLIQAQKSGEKSEDALGRIVDSMKSLPVVGLATISLSAIVNSLSLSWGYFTQDSSSSYFSWMAAQLFGKALADHLAERAVEMIYDPSWRLMMTYLLTDLIKALEKPAVVSSAVSPQDVQVVAQYLFSHFAPMGKSIPKILPEDTLWKMSKQIGEWFDTSLVADPEEFVSAALQPPLKELILSYRVCDHFRTNVVHFEGDAKFWQVFVCQVLNARVGNQFRAWKSAPQQERARFRQELVDELFTQDAATLVQTLSEPITFQEEPLAKSTGKIQIVEEYKQDKK